MSLSTATLLSELQARGARLLATNGPGLSRVGGAGPSDHKAVSLDGQTVMVPVFTQAAADSPFELRQDLLGEGASLFRYGERVARVRFARTPAFYARSTADGIPYWKLATLHADDVLATTVLQHCVRYGKRESACQFCAIGASLAADRTIAKKSPEQLAEVAQAAVELDGVRHMVLTTGTPPSSDRGARVLSECAEAITRRVALPLQAQCEPPDDDAWFARLRETGVRTLGMHLEAVEDDVRRRIMPGKAEVPLARYFDAFAAAVEVFGRGQVTTYILAGLGDAHESILAMAERLLAIGVYPFVVPFVPIAGTPLAAHPSPAPAFMEPLLAALSRTIAASGMRSQDIAAGCGRCGACSTLRARETEAA